jgi:hypothetical protein
MNIEDKDRLRKISFREFADEWIDKLNDKYDAIGNLWVNTFRAEISEYLNNLGNRVDADSALTIIGIFDYARARRPATSSGDNINPHSPHT